jgi:type VI secretion system secreted protein Hcp
MTARSRMPFSKMETVRIRYEEAGSGFPLLVIPGGGLNSSIRKDRSRMMRSPGSNGRESEEIQRLLKENAQQAKEIERLRARLTEDKGRASRRALLKGLGLTSLLALGAGTGVLSTTGRVEATPSGGTEISGLAGSDTPFLELYLNGSFVEGTSRRERFEDHIETIYFRQRSAPSSGQPGPRGGDTSQPIVIRKAVDKASPLLLRGLANDELAEGTFGFRRIIEGEVSDYWELEFQGRIVEVEQYLPEIWNREGKEVVNLLEQVTFSVRQFTVRYEDGERVTIRS